MNDEQEIEQEEQQPVIDDDLAQISELDAILAEAESVDGGVIGETGEIVEHVESEHIETAELLYPIISAGFDIFASKWNVPEKHKKALAEAYGDLLDKYFPDAGSVFGVELTALTVTGMVVAPHIIAEPEKEVNKPPKQPEKPPEKAEGIKPVVDYRPTYQEQEGFKLD
ncbi:hypothetical protein [Thalassotalea hakodatensis]|uniref:hypothetical protein n=1 Tax=Thalassotalea hakodatensis TaxID=3030492 RepID=UPI002573FDE2|nr:hypothetical protein [Thalassotalea hakodatensis]